MPIAQHIQALFNTPIEPPGKKILFLQKCVGVEKQREMDIHTLCPQLLNPSYVQKHNNGVVLTFLHIGTELVTDGKGL